MGRALGSEFANPLAGRNGFEYFLDRRNGQFLKAVQHVDQVTWTKGIDPKTGKPIEYEPGKDFQLYAEPANASDPVLLCVPEHRRATLLAARQQEGTRVVYRFDIVLQGEGETAFFNG